MLSTLLPDAGETVPADHPVPYATFAELLRLLLPDVRAISFFDRSNRISWSSVGVGDPALTNLVANMPPDARRSRTLSNASSMTHIATVRAPDGLFCGTLALVFDPSGSVPGAAQRPRDLDERLAAVLRILGYTMSTASEPIVAAAAEPVTPPRIPTMLGAAARVKSAPVLLRRSLSIALGQTSCAFGAFIAADQRYTFLHHGNESQLQVDMRGIAEALRQPLADHVATQPEPVIITNPPWVEVSDFQLVVCPVRDGSARLVAVLMLLRRRHDPPFGNADAASLQGIAIRIPGTALEELAPLAVNATSTPKRELPETAVAAASPAEPPVAMSDLLRAALRKNRFALHAQSISPLREPSATQRYEILLRLNAGDGLQAPDAFLETARTNGLLAEIDRWVVGQLLKTLRPHADALHAGRWEFALNISAASLESTNFSEFIEAQLFRSPVPPRSLVFEFSESDALAHRTQFEQLAKRLAELGCRLALDNCRQGLDIFFAIGRLPIHRLKIDAALTHQLRDSRAEHAVRELAEVARDIGIETVGERVEDESTRQRLSELGIDFAQGRSISPPQPLIELLNHGTGC